MAMKPGTYDVKAKGHGSSYMSMQVKLSEDKIENINVNASGETRGVADEVFNRLPKLIVDNQTLNVDAVSGATISSHGVIDGVAEAITEAGGDAEEWKKRAKPSKAHATKDEEYTTDVVVIGPVVLGWLQLRAVSNMVEKLSYLKNSHKLAAIRLVLVVQ